MNAFLDDEDEDECNLYTNSVARLKALKKQAVSKTEETEDVKRDDLKPEDFFAACVDTEAEPIAEPIVGPVTRSRTRKGAKKSNKSKKSKKSGSKRNSQCPAVESDIEIVSLSENDNEFNKPQGRIITAINLVEDDEDDVIVCHDSDSADENYDMDIKVLWKSKKFHRFTIHRHEHFQKVFEHFAKLENVPVEQILITKKDKTVHYADTPASISLSIIDILEGGVVNPDAVIQIEDEKSENVCSIKVQTADKRSLVVQLKMNERLKKLITSCAEQLGVKEANIKLYFDGEQISETDTPESLEFEQEACIDLRIYG